MTKVIIKTINRCVDCDFIVKEHGFSNDTFIGCEAFPIVKEIAAVGGLVKYPEVGSKPFETDPKETVQPWCPLPDEKKGKKDKEKEELRARVKQLEDEIQAQYEDGDAQ